MFGLECKATISRSSQRERAEMAIDLASAGEWFCKLGFLSVLLQYSVCLIRPNTTTCQWVFCRVSYPSRRFGCQAVGFPRNYWQRVSALFMC